MAAIGIIGSEGRMGHALLQAIADAGHTCSGGIDRGGDVAALASASEVLVDFSAPEALEANLAATLGAGIPIVIGTTGLSESHHSLIDRAAGHVAVLQTGNTSLGVTLLAHLVRDAASRLGDDWDIEERTVAQLASFLVSFFAASAISVKLTGGFAGSSPTSLNASLL